MRASKGKTVDEILGKLSPSEKEIVDALRGLVKETLPDIVETVKWGNITYVLNGKNLSWIIIYKNHVDFGFFKGAEFTSPLLEGTGKELRHIKIHKIEDIDRPEIKRLLNKSAELTS